MSEMITFKYLREIQKKERSSAGLCKLDAGFYGAVSDYVLRKKRIKDRGKELSFREKKEIENIRPVVKSIYDTRETKIVGGALKAARTGMKMANLLPDEENLLKDVRERIEDARRGLESVLSSAGGKTRSLDESEEVGDSEDGMSQIRIIEDIPEFVGEDLKTYGPWKAGETATCPKNFADIFVKNGKAEDVGRDRH